MPPDRAWPLIASLCLICLERLHNLTHSLRHDMAYAAARHRRNRASPSPSRVRANHDDVDHDRRACDGHGDDLHGSRGGALCSHPDLLSG
jgi:hypothetical protein